MKNEGWRIRIGVLVERQRAYGRRLCEGVAAYAGEHPGISLGMLEWRDLNDVRSYSRYDAFIVRVLDDRMEQALRRTRKPVVDVFYGKRRNGFAVADCDNAASRTPRLDRRSVRSLAFPCRTSWQGRALKKHADCWNRA